MIKILHCADLHLDSPMSVLDVAKAEARRRDLRAALTSLTMFIKSNAVDFLLIAGDLFDGEFVSRDTVALLCREFASIPDCRVIIAPGNHDPYTFSSHYRLTDFPENVYVFDSEEVKSFDFPEKNTTVYGWAFTSDALEACPLEGFEVASRERINLLVAHGELDGGESKYCPIPSKTLAACGFDYAALGHVHTHGGVLPLGDGYVAYSGCLEGRGFDECGIKGAVLAVAGKTDKLDFAAKFERFCKRYYEIAKCDVSGSASNADVLTKLTAFIKDAHFGDDVALRLHLRGSVASDFKMSTAFLIEQFPQLYRFEIVDETVPLADSDRLSNDPTIRGAYYRSLEPMLASANASEREIAAMALRYGLAALAGNDIADE